MKPNKFSVTMAFIDGNTAVMYLGNSRTLALYYYLINTIFTTVGATFVILEEDFTVN